MPTEAAITLLQAVRDWRTGMQPEPPTPLPSIQDQSLAQWMADNRVTPDRLGELAKRILEAQ